MADLLFRIAVAEQASAIADLINRCYRGDASRQGWTTEADLLDGTRTDAEQVLALIGQPGSLILLGWQDNMLRGSIHLQQHGEAAHIGMFVVDPACQGRGLGKQLLAQAEKLSWLQWQPRHLLMMVITVRHELLAYYERRGYKRTGQQHDFPVNPAMWQPKVAGLRFEILEKLPPA